MIPHIIHQMWIGGAMPAWMQPFPKTWVDHHPDWEYVMWTRPPELVNGRLWADAEQISPRAPEQFRSDVARLEILHQYGGVWVDTDMECLRPIDGLATTEFMGWEVQDRWANNALLGAQPDSAFLADAIEQLPASSTRSGSNTVKSGPQFITPIALRHEVVIYPQHYFYPYAYSELGRAAEDYPDSYAVHHWANQRRLRNRPL